MIYVIFHRGKSNATEFGSSMVYQHWFSVLSIEKLHSNEELGIGEVTQARFVQFGLLNEL